MNRGRLIAILAVLGVGTFVLMSSLYTVSEVEQAIITQFGEPIGAPVSTAPEDPPHAATPITRIAIAATRLAHGSRPDVMWSDLGSLAGQMHPKVCLGVDDQVPADVHHDLLETTGEPEGTRVFRGDR